MPYQNRIQIQFDSHRNSAESASDSTTKATGGMGSTGSTGCTGSTGSTGGTGGTGGTGTEDDAPTGPAPTLKETPNDETKRKEEDEGQSILL